MKDSQHHLIDGSHQHNLTKFYTIPAHIKIASVFIFVLLVVLTPGKNFQAHLSFAVIVLAMLIWNRIPLSLIRKRLIIEIPFVLFAFFYPFSEQDLELIFWIKIVGSWFVGWLEYFG